jgi:hypothetical protein
MPHQIPPSVRLDDLIEGIRRASPEDVGAQLGQAVVVAEHLGEVSDHLVGHFVDQARRSGLSWTEIGRSMGVTKQAAQKRFVPRGPDETFARFTPAARSAVVASQELARANRSLTIEPAHLVLGLLDVPQGIAARLLAAAGLADAVRSSAGALLTAGEEEPPALIPFSPEAKKALELTFRHAVRLGDEAVGTQHVLLALVEVEDGAGPLSSAGVDAGTVEAALAGFGPTDVEEAA